MNATQTEAPTKLTASDPAVARFLTAWHENGRAHFQQSYPSLDYDSDAYRKTVPLDTAYEPVAPGVLQADAELAHCISRLPEIQKQVITLYYLEEKRVDDVARLLDLPEGTVKSHLHRARLALAAMMKG